MIKHTDQTDPDFGGICLRNDMSYIYGVNLNAVLYGNSKWLRP